MNLADLFGVKPYSVKQNLIRMKDKLHFNNKTTTVIIQNDSS